MDKENKEACEWDYLWAACAAWEKNPAESYANAGVVTSQEIQTQRRHVSAPALRGVLTRFIIPSQTSLVARGHISCEQRGKHPWERLQLGQDVEQHTAERYRSNCSCFWTTEWIHLNASVYLCESGRKLHFNKQAAPQRKSKSSRKEKWVVSLQRGNSRNPFPLKCSFSAHLTESCNSEFPSTDSLCFISVFSKLHSTGLNVCIRQRHHGKRLQTSSNRLHQLPDALFPRIFFTLFRGFKEFKQQVWRKLSPGSCRLTSGFPQGKTPKPRRRAPLQNQTQTLFTCSSSERLSHSFFLQFLPKDKTTGEVWIRW